MMEADKRNITPELIQRTWLGLEQLGGNVNGVYDELDRDERIQVQTNEIVEVGAFCKALYSGEPNLAQKIADENHWESGYVGELVQWWYFNS